MDRGFEFTVNGAPVRVEVPADTPLLIVLRNELGLTGTRFGCGQEQCGACVVLLDDEPTYSCGFAVDAVAGRVVRTVECLQGDGSAANSRHPLIDAFLHEQAGQCGYCLSGILMSATALLERNPNPVRAEICAALDRHLCRCGAHNRIIAAIERASAHTGIP